MNTDEWNEFLANKSRSVKAVYSLRRVCGHCGRPIINTNKKGLCRKCSGLIGFYKKEATCSRESPEHILLKRKAAKFLRRLGYIDIYEETRLGNAGRGNYITVDVLGVLGLKKVAVECGGSAKGKLGKLRGRVSEIYILPYGVKKPFLWVNGVKVCHSCGHKI